MKKILIVDDEEKIRNVIKEYSIYEGYECYEASDGIEAISMCKENKYDLIVLDIMMPKLDGFSTAKEIRKFSNIPIIMLSARGEEYDKLFGFEVGIDDYVTKPFSPKELMARIKANLKRNDKLEETIVFSGVTIDSLGHNVFVDEKKIDLTNKEYDLLLYLISNKNIVLNREQILNNVWNMDYLGEERTIDTHIKTLRASLGQYKDYIVTVRGVGYKFEDINRKIK